MSCQHYLVQRSASNNRCCQVYYPSDRRTTISQMGNQFLAVTSISQKIVTIRLNQVGLYAPRLILCAPFSRMHYSARSVLIQKSKIDLMSSLF